MQWSVSQQRLFPSFNANDPPWKYFPSAFPKSTPVEAMEALCQLRSRIAEVTYSTGAISFKETDPILRALVTIFGIEAASCSLASGAKEDQHLDEAGADELRAQLRRIVPWTADVPWACYFELVSPWVL